MLKLLKSWWLRLRLWFRPWQCGVDFGFEDKSCIIWGKELNGRLYILKTEWINSKYKRGKKVNSQKDQEERDRTSRR